jgi:hypothetical protein
MPGHSQLQTTRLVRYLHSDSGHFATTNGHEVHGGLILSLTDTLGSLAVATKGQYMTGVSTDIGTSFVRPAGRVGDVLHTKTVLTGMGKQLAYTRTDYTNAQGELVAYGCAFNLRISLGAWRPKLFFRSYQIYREIICTCCELFLQCYVF